MKDSVGLIGAGLVGTAIAERLLSAGYDVIGYDVRPEQREHLARIGGVVRSSASGVAPAVNRLILSLPNSGIARTVLTEILPVINPGTIVVDTTTGAPEDAADFHAMLSAAGAEYLNATISGSSSQVRSREAILICGGSPDAFERCSDLFGHFARKAYHVGPAGSSARMKLVVNLVLGLTRAALAEGLEFARASGIDPWLALDILKSGPAYSRPMDTKGARMLSGNFEPEARLSQHLKDVRLILASGKALNAKLPLTAIHQELLEIAEEAGFGNSDNSAIIKAFQTKATPTDEPSPQSS